jgi:hypothetical protein
MQLTGVSSFTMNKPAQNAGAVKQPSFGAISDSFKDRGKGLEEEYFQRIEREVNKKLEAPEIKAFLTSDAVAAVGEKPAIKAVKILQTIRENEKTEDSARYVRSDKALTLTPDLLDKFAPEQQAQVKSAVKRMYQLGLIEVHPHPQLTHARVGGGNRNIVLTDSKQAEGLKATLLGNRAILRFKEA